jgi:hypothetical protein
MPIKDIKVVKKKWNDLVPGDIIISTLDANQVIIISRHMEWCNETIEAYKKAGRIKQLALCFLVIACDHVAETITCLFPGEYSHTKINKGDTITCLCLKQ